MPINIKKDFGSNRGRKPDLSAMVYGKVPPQSPDLEKLILGALIQESHKLEDVVSILPTPDSFYVDAHQRIYKAILELYQLSSPIDFALIAEQLQKNSDLETVGGRYYLSQLTLGVINSAHVIPHAQKVAEKYMARELIRISGVAISDAYEDATDVFELVGTAATDMDNIISRTLKRKVRPIKSVVAEAMREISDQQSSSHDFTGVPTGFAKLDSMTGGWQPAELIIIAARPSVGKTAFCLNLAWNAATNTHKPTPTAIFSLEMKDKSLVKRMFAKVGAIQGDNIKHPKRMQPAEVARLNKAAEDIAKSKIFIDETPGLSLMEFTAKARKLVREEGVGLIIVDYLQLMTITLKSNDNREQEISKISRDVKKTAKELSIPIIALSQLNRGIEHTDRAPRLSDLRESGAIEQDADIVAFLFRPTKEIILSSPGLYDGKVMISIEKQRDGSTGEFALEFRKEYQEFTDAFSNPFPQQSELTPAQNHRSMMDAAQRREPYKDDTDTPLSGSEEIEDIPF